MAFLIYLTLLTTAVITQVTASCPAVCECPDEPLVCPPGVSTVPDGCGCCKVCAAQLNQDCSPTRPCDHHKGLECNYGNDVTMAWGICIDGAVGCAPLCTNKLPPASPSCPYPRLVRIPGQCCFSVVCHKGTWWLPPKHQVPPPQQHLTRRQHQPENELANELADAKSSGWESEHGYKHLPVWNHLKEKKCPVQTTDWSQCSRSCGMGVSSRITNKNPQCKLERETRICTVRPCHGLTVPAKRGKKCSPTQKAPEPIRLSYGECVSVRLYRPNYCGVCADGQCCSPRRTRTVPVRFVCPDGERFQRSAMFIQSCKCSDDCGHLNEVALPPQQWMYGDTHQFID